MKVLLGVSGSIAAYRAADLARELMRAGHEVRVCLTDGAAQFVTPLLFETLTGQPVLSGAFEEPIAGRMAHIDWARWADVIVVAPATANTLVRLGLGFAEDMLTTVVLASSAPLVVAPAMNPSMYAADVVAFARERLAARATIVVEPQEGDVVAGEHGPGKLAPIAEIVAAVQSLDVRRNRLAGKHVLITSGPTVESIDDVRFLSNRSSGKMGAALARAALLMGARVTVVAGPQSAVLPLEATVFKVETALEMLAAAHAVPEPDVIIGAAAVADYRPLTREEGKIRRDVGNISLQLTPNPDVIASLAATFPGAQTVAFAAEPGPDVATARAKMVRKGVFAMAVNDISRPGIGFGADDNALQLLFADGRDAESGERSKLACGIWLLEQLTP